MVYLPLKYLNNTGFYLSQWRAELNLNDIITILFSMIPAIF